MSVEQKRRDFIGMSFGTVAAVGAGFSLFAMKRTWDPLPSVEAAGFTTVDLSVCEPGVIHQVTWRKKPIFILKKTPEMSSDDAREIKVGNDRYSIMIGICTHLGCIPAYNPSRQQFVCACHGGVFDTNGINVFGPPPRPFDIPPFAIKDTKLELGKEGDEYKKMLAAAKA